MEFETIDWQAEALRIERAFGIEAECEFVVADTESSIEFMELIPKNRQRQRCVALAGSRNVFLACGYGEDGLRGFELTFDDGLGDEIQILTHIVIESDGNLYSEIVDKAYSETLAKGLFHLGLLTPEVEAALKVSITAHQKLEWRLEYEARYGV